MQSPSRHLLAGRQIIARTTCRVACPIALLAMLAVPMALSAAAPTASATPLPAPPTISGLTPQAIEELLAGIRVGGEGLSASELEVAKLAKVLSELPGIDELSGLAGLGGTSGLQTALRQSLEGLLASGEGTLSQLLSPSALTGELLTKLQGIIHVPATPLIEALLGHSPQAVLEGGLGSVELNELLARLLDAAQDPTQLADSLVEALDPAMLSSLLGSLPAGAPQNLDVSAVAGELAMTPAALAEALGQTTASLPPTAAAVVSALQSGDALAFLHGGEGLVLALIAKATEVTEEGGLGGGETGGGSSGGNAGGQQGAQGTGGATGASGNTPATTTVVLNVSAATNAPTKAGAARATAGRVRILAKHVRRRVATLVVQVPSAGRLTVSGSGVKRVVRKEPKTARVVLHIKLTKAASAALARHRRRLAVTLHAAFEPVHGAPSFAAAKLMFHP